MIKAGDLINFALNFDHKDPNINELQHKILQAIVDGENAIYEDYTNEDIEDGITDDIIEHFEKLGYFVDHMLYPTQKGITRITISW